MQAHFSSSLGEPHVWVSHSYPRHMLGRVQEEDRLLCFHCVVTGADSRLPPPSLKLLFFWLFIGTPVWEGSAVLKMKEETSGGKNPGFYFSAQVNEVALCVKSHTYITKETYEKADDVRAEWPTATGTTGTQERRLKVTYIVSTGYFRSICSPETDESL